MVLEKARDQPPARLTGAQSGYAGSCADSRRRTKRGGSDPLKWETGRNEAPVSGERVLGNRAEWTLPPPQDVSKGRASGRTAEGGAPGGDPASQTQSGSVPGARTAREPRRERRA